MSVDGTTRMRRGSKEWRRAWAELERQHPDGDTEDEAWQYMGTTDGKHEFRHRAYPGRGRIVVKIEAVA